MLGDPCQAVDTAPVRRMSPSGRAGATDQHQREERPVSPLGATTVARKAAEAMTCRVHTSTSGAGEKGVRASAGLTRGLTTEVAESITDTAETFGADLIVFTPHNRGPSRRCSVPGRVMRSRTTPVLRCCWPRGKPRRTDPLARRCRHPFYSSNRASAVTSGTRSSRCPVGLSRGSRLLTPPRLGRTSSGRRASQSMPCIHCKGKRLRAATCWITEHRPAPRRRTGPLRRLGDLRTAGLTLQCRPVARRAR